jgi:hypothetical protein
VLATAHFDGVIGEPMALREESLSTLRRAYQTPIVRCVEIVLDIIGMHLEGGLHGSWVTFRCVMVGWWAQTSF